MTNILFLKPYLEDKIWGGSNLKSLNIKLNSLNVGEAWVISGFKDKPSMITNDSYKGKSLYEFYQSHQDFFGNCKSKQYPLLVKILDCNDKLSVQVHPKTGVNQKNEAWFVINSKRDAQIIYGHTAKTKTEFVAMVKKGEWTKLLKSIYPNKHDIFNIPSGKLHALGKGLLIYEVQQPSDTTYRLYDYDRGRNMDVNKAIDNIDIPSKSISTNKTGLLKTPYFSMKYINNNGFKHYAFKAKWLQVSVINGNGKINEVVIKKGDTFITSHNLTSFNLKGKIELIVSYL